MKAKLKRYGLAVFYWTSILCLLLLMGSNLAPYLNPDQWWLISLLGLVFPLLFATVALFTIIWLLIGRKRAILPAIALLTSVPNIIASFGFHPGASFTEQKRAGTIRVVTWNVGLMNYMAKDTPTARTNNARILDALHGLDADVVCLQEFFTAVTPGNYYNLIDSISRVSAYPYHYFSYDYPKFDSGFYSGTIIFSKHPITDSAKEVFPKPFAGSVIRAGIGVGSDTIDVFSTRLQSVYFGSNEYRIINSLKKGGDGDLGGSKNLIRKLRFGYRQRAMQTQLVKGLVQKSTRPVVLTGDLNDVAAGYTYHQLKAGMGDAWLSKGWGMGRTFRLISPTLRIDYIFYNDAFACLQTKRIRSGGSDHHGLVTDLQLKRQP